MTRLVRLVAATALVAAAGLTGPAPAAYAGACSTDDGVTVVVDPHGLGGGLKQVCDGGGGGQKAAVLFPDNGFPLDYVQRQPGFVCRVSGAPAEDPCVNTPPADAYWGLWWSDGDSGSWTYSTVGVGSLSIPAGGAVALSWNGSSTKSPPGASPPQHAAEPTEEPQPDRPPSSSGPTQQPSQPPTSGGGGTPTSTPSGSAEPTGSASAAPRAGRDRPHDAGHARSHQEQHEDDATPSIEPTPTEEPTPVAASSEGTDPAEGGLPVWVGPVAVGGLLGVAGVATYLRRRSA